MKTIQKTTSPLLLIVFFIATACNTPAVLGEISSSNTENPISENLTLSPTPFLPDAAGSETGETETPSPSQLLEPGQSMFTTEPVEAIEEAHQPKNTKKAADSEIPALNDTQAFSADTSLPPTETNAPEATQESEMEIQSLDPADFTAEISDSGAGCGVKGNAAFEEILLNLINQERANQGLNELVFDPKLIETARKHSLDMACENYFNHTGSDGSSPFTRIGAVGYPYETAGENIYAGSGPYNCAQEAFKAWMKSAAHQEVMLNQTFMEIGIGYAFNPDSTYGGYFTAVFASR